MPKFHFYVERKIFEEFDIEAPDLSMADTMAKAYGYHAGPKTSNHKKREDQPRISIRRIEDSTE